MKKNSNIVLFLIIFTAAFLIPLPETVPQKISIDPLKKEGLLRITFFSVGQGDAILIVFPNSRTLLIDGGIGSIEYVDFDAGEMVIAPYLKKKKITCLDGVVLTHPHSDHLGGLLYILDRVRVRNIFDAGLKNNTQLYHRYLQLIREKKLNCRALYQGDEIVFDEKVKLKILSPPENNKQFKDLNDRSLVIKVIYNRISLLLAGDIGEEAEQRLIKMQADLKADILKVAHHGDNASSPGPFVRAVNPRIAIISTGKSNKYGEDVSLTEKIYKEDKIKIYRTDIHGRIELNTDGLSWQVRTRRKG